MATQKPEHKFAVKAQVKIVRDLSGKEPEVVGRNAAITELLPAVGKHPQYKVLIFGEGKVKGGIFAVDERELESAK